MLKYIPLALGLVYHCTLEAQQYMPQDETYRSLRPVVSERKFHSRAVEKLIDEVQGAISDAKLRWLFVNCFPNTLDTTVKFTHKDGKPSSFIITGDIEAMWLRDSSAQIHPYLALAGQDKALRELICGLIRKQLSCILIDPYANAFNDAPIGSYWQSDITQTMALELHERKWEIDSLCYPIRLAYTYWLATGDTSIFDENWRKAMKLILRTFREQQRKDSLGPYSFMRKCDKASDSQINAGFGAPTRYTGMIVSAFRPSDDATQYGFLIPSNMFAVVSLRQMAQIHRELLNDQEIAQEAETLAQEVDRGIQRYGKGVHPTAGEIYAYEVDGYGNALFMDDANVPSLLAIPYLGYLDAHDPVYQRTRALVWSEQNPYFFRGKAGEGVGGPHVGLRQAWPMSIIMRALTSQAPREIQECLHLLVSTDADTGFMHESFDVDNPKQFTRSWFAWANTLFGELILKLYNERPELLKVKYYNKQ